jgi:predicted CXXCH cytochrome family protein
VTLAISCLLLPALFYGCAVKSRYEILSFFFDGVPSPEEAAGKGEKVKKEEEQKKTGYREHGPYAAKACEGCHIRGSNNLVVPINELCFQCHTLDLKKKYLHGPLAGGGCKVCHEPHGSRYAFLLVAESREFCLYCHSKKDILRNPVHEGVQEQCTACHDAHGADNRYLLK